MKRDLSRYKLAITFCVLFVVTSIAAGVQHIMDRRFETEGISESAEVVSKTVQRDIGSNKPPYQFYYVVVLKFPVKTETRAHDMTVRHNMASQAEWEKVTIGQTLDIVYPKGFPGMVRLKSEQNDKAAIRENFNGTTGLAALWAVMALISFAAGAVSRKRIHAR